MKTSNENVISVCALIPLFSQSWSCCSFQKKKKQLHTRSQFVKRCGQLPAKYFLTFHSPLSVMLPFMPRFGTYFTFATWNLVDWYHLNVHSLTNGWGLYCQSPLQSFILFGNDEDLVKFNESYRAIQYYMRRGLVDVVCYRACGHTGIVCIDDENSSWNAVIASRL